MTKDSTGLEHSLWLLNRIAMKSAFLLSPGKFESPLSPADLSTQLGLLRSHVTALKTELTHDDDQH